MSKITNVRMYKTEEQKLKEDSDIDNNTKAFDFLIEIMKRKVKFEIEEYKKGETEESVREENKRVKENGCFIRVEEENQTEMSKKSRNSSWSSNTHKIEEADCQENMGVTRRTELIVNYQERQNITM